MSISLNDHERRIKDFEGKIIEIGDRITSVESNQMSYHVSYQTNGSVDAPHVIVIFEKIGNRVTCRFYTDGYTGGNNKRHGLMLENLKTEWLPKSSITYTYDKADITINPSGSVNVYSKVYNGKFTGQSVTYYI